MVSRSKSRARFFTRLAGAIHRIGSETHGSPGATVGHQSSRRAFPNVLASHPAAPNKNTVPTHRTDCTLLLVHCKMATRLAFENSNEVGVFAALTNAYCLTGTTIRHEVLWQRPMDDDGSDADSPLSFVVDSLLT
jgi:hypothetical protein